MEYAFYLDPKQSNNPTALPMFSFVTNASQRFGALSFTRFKLAADLIYQPQAANTITGAWAPLTNIFTTITNAVTDRVTYRDDQPANASPQRFYRLQVNLQ